MIESVHEYKIATQKIVVIFNTGDLAEVDTLFAAEYIDHQKPAWVDAAGAEEFKQIVLGARASLPNLQVTIEALIAEGESVAARLHWHSAHPSGNVIDRETIDMLRFVDGKVVEHWGAEAWAKETAQNDQTS
ncbi:MAG TPA: ester cyclase [Ktedonobacterales bacterium]|nr:ester cyclase [Ktedonobacterales bacterium]